MSSLLPSRTLSRSVIGPDGQPAVKIEALPVRPGEVLNLTFESVGPRWRQGVFLATSGTLEVGGARAPSFVFWSDTAPAESLIKVAETEGRLVVYNVWDSGRGKHPFESQSATSGMLVEELRDGVTRYQCNDIGAPPDFQRLVFLISRPVTMRAAG